MLENTMKLNYTAVITTQVKIRFNTFFLELLIKLSQY